MLNTRRLASFMAVWSFDVTLYIYRTNFIGQIASARLNCKNVDAKAIAADNYHIFQT